VIPIEVGTDTVRLDSEKVEIDLCVLRKAVNPIDPTTEDDEFETLSRHLDDFALPLAPGSHEHWLEPERLAWSLEAIGMLIRLAELAESRSDWETQRRAAFAGLEHVPQDEELWNHALRASARVGRDVDAVRAWSRRRVQLQADGEDFSRELIDLARDLRAPAKAGYGYLGRDEEDVLLRLSERCLREDPRALLGMFCSPSFIIEAKRRPDAALTLLNEALANRPMKTSEETGCRVARVAILGFLDRWPEAIAEGEELLRLSLEPGERLQLLNSVSFGSMFAGDLKNGLAHLDELVKLCEDRGWQHAGWQAHCTRASCLWMLTEFDASDRLFSRCITYLDSLRDLDVGAFLAVVRSNHASLLADMGRFSESLNLALQADVEARKLGVTDAACRTAATIARASYSLGRPSDASSQAKRAIRLAVRQASVRLHVNTLENIGLGLLAGQDLELGSTLLRTGWAIRLAHSLPTEALFQWRRTEFSGDNTAPEPIYDSKAALVQAFRQMSLDQAM